MQKAKGNKGKDGKKVDAKLARAMAKQAEPEQLDFFAEPVDPSTNKLKEEFLALFEKIFVQEDHVPTAAEWDPVSADRHFQ